jgi:hypothetical protein
VTTILSRSRKISLILLAVAVLGIAGWFALAVNR